MDHGAPPSLLQPQTCVEYCSHKPPVSPHDTVSLGTGKQAFIVPETWKAAAKKSVTLALGLSLSQGLTTLYWGHAPSLYEP
jgi:hypothetical protein